MNETAKKDVKVVDESTHAKKVGGKLVKLTHGIDTCVRKEHTFPEFARGEE